MIERVARAIESAQFGYRIALTRMVDDESTYTLTLDGKGSREFGSYEGAKSFVLGLQRRTQARAAIAAMREPTPAMFEASSRTPGMKRVDEIVMASYARTGVDTLKEACADGYPIHQSWRAMIDEALREETT